MNRKTPATTALALALLPILFVVGLGGCSFYTMKEHPSGDPWRLKQNPPTSLAIMPVIDHTGHEGLDAMARRSLYAALAPLRYRDTELNTIDETLASLSLERNCPPSRLTSTDVAKRNLADGLLYAEVLKRSRFWFLIYSHIRVRIKLTLIDTRSNEVVYTNDATLYKHRISLPLSLTSIPQSWLETLWDIRAGEVATVLDQFSERVAKSFPDPEVSGGDQIGIDGVFVSFPQPVLRPGDPLGVEVRGTPGLRGTFDVGKMATGQALEEQEPGIYRGAYCVSPGDHDDTGVVQAHLISATGYVVTKSKLDSGFRINAAAPPRPEIERVQFLKDSVCLHLSLPPLSDCAAIEIFRTEDPKQGYLPLDQVKGLSWIDHGVTPGHRYWYLVKAIDSGGNTSLHSAPKVVDVPEKGPTVLPATLQGSVTLHLYSSPYQVLRTTIVPPGSSLRVEPGTEIQVWPGARIRIEGDASFEGLEDEPVRIIGKHGGTLVQFEPQDPKAILRGQNVVFRGALLALDAKRGRVAMECVRFEDLGRGLIFDRVENVRLSRCDFDDVGVGIEGTAVRMEAEFCGFQNFSRGISVHCPALELHNNDFAGDGIAVSQLNAAPTRVDDNFFDSTDPIALLGRVQGPCVFSRIYLKPSAQRRPFALADEPYESCRLRGDSFFEQKDYVHALRSYLDAWWQRKDRDLGLRLVELLASSEKPEAAMHVARTLAILYPSDTEILGQYARSLERLGLGRQAGIVRKRMERAR